MTKLIVRGAIAASLLSAIAGLSTISARAVTEDRSSWCAVYNTGSENCHFTNMAQCVSSASGFGGFCRMSPYGMSRRYN